MDSVPRTFWSFLAVVLFWNKNIKCDGVFSLKLINYTNPRHMLSSGKCCEDGDWPPKCNSDCDNYFIICFSKMFNGTCSYGRYWLDEVGSDTLTFPSSIWGVSPSDITNPIEIPFKKWKGFMHVKIETYDSDHSVDTHNHLKNDYVDTMTLSYNAASPGSKETSLNTHSIMAIKGKVATINIGVSVNCKSKYLIPTCEEYCIDKDDNTGHVKCDYKLGKRLCRTGWFGKDCTSRKPLCTPRDDKFGHYQCNKTTDEKICLPGWQNPSTNCTEELAAFKSTSTVSSEEKKTDASSEIAKSTQIHQGNKFTRSAMISSSIADKNSERLLVTPEREHSTHSYNGCLTTLRTPNAIPSPSKSRHVPKIEMSASTVIKLIQPSLSGLPSFSTKNYVRRSNHDHSMNPKFTTKACSSELMSIDKSTTIIQKERGESPKLKPKQRKSLIYATTIGPFLVLFISLLIFLARMAHKRKRPNTTCAENVSMDEELPKNQGQHQDKRCMFEKPRFWNTNKIEDSHHIDSRDLQLKDMR